MLKNRWGVVVAVLAVPQLAFAGGAAWCKEKTSAGSYELRKLSDKNAELQDSVVTVAQLSCSDDAELEASRGDIDKARQQLGQKLGMDEGDWPDVLEFDRERMGNFLKTEFSTKSFAQMTPIDQYWAISQDFDSTPSDELYRADALEQSLTMTGRMAFLSWCLKDDLGGAGDNAARWALCQGDVDAFDAQKVLAEVKTDKAHSGAARMWLRLRALEVQDELKELAAKKAKAIKDDEEFKKVFDVAQKAREDWKTTIGTNSKLLDLARAMDNGAFFQSRKLLDGCQATTAAALAEAVGRLPAKTFAGMNDVREDPFGGFASKAGPVLAQDPVVHLAASAYVECQAKTPTGDFLAAYIQYAPGARGPRSAALTALVASQKTFKFDDLKLELRVPAFGERPYARSGGSISSAGGVVKSVKKGGEQLVVSLEKTTRKQEECVKEHQTNRIIAILRDGTLQYERICDKWAIVTRDSTWSDFQIRPQFEPQLKKGSVFSAIMGDGFGDVAATWPSKDAKLPNWVLGATLK